MKFFKVVFFLFAVYGFVAGFYGAAMIALCAAALAHYAQGVYAKQDKQAPTSDAQCKHRCEHCESKNKS